MNMDRLCKDSVCALQKIKASHQPAVLQRRSTEAYLHLAVKQHATTYLTCLYKLTGLVKCQIDKVLFN